MALPEEVSSIVPARLNYLGTAHDLNAEAISVLNTSVPGRMEIVGATRDFASVAAHTGGTYSETITGLEVGDYCFFIGTDGAGGTNFGPWILKTAIVCTGAGGIDVYYYNAHTAALDPVSQTLYFLVIHNS